MYRLKIVRRRYQTPVTRAGGLATVLVVALVSMTGAAFANLQSQPATLKGGTIQTAIASLQLSKDGTNYTKTLSGYNFGNLVPGGQPSPSNGYPVYVRNVGTAPLALKLSVSNTVTNPDTIDLSKVHVLLRPVSGGAIQTVTLETLIAADSTGGVAVAGASHMLPGETDIFTIQVSLDSDAVNGEGATISNLDFNFGGIAVN